MKFLRSIFALGGALAFGIPSLAHADALPPDGCLETDIGKPCSNADPNAENPGTCVAAKCSSPRPDGGSETYDCGQCVAVDGGASSSSSGGASSSSSGGASSSSGGASSSSSGSSADDDDADDDGGCSTSPASRDTFTGAGMLGLGLLAYAWSRRKQSHR